jgi:tetratricopeptide (TPR) repeat protein
MWFERALKLHPRSALAYSGLGWAHSGLKEYQQAVEDFTYALQLLPSHPLLYLGRGQVYRRLKVYDQVLSDLDHALQLDQRLSGAYNCRARTYVELKEYQKALRELDSALEVASDRPLAGLVLFRQGCTHLLLKDLPQATTCFTRGYELGSALGLFPWIQDLLVWAREWSLMCQTSPGPQTLRTLQALSSGEPYPAYVCRGVVLCLQKEFQQALTELQYAVDLRYDENQQRFLMDYWREWDVHFWLAMTYLALDKEEEARVAIEQALAVEMPLILLKPLSWFERERPGLYEKFIKPLLDGYRM